MTSAIFRHWTFVAFTALCLLTAAASEAQIVEVSLDGAQRIAGGLALPISTEGPAWYDQTFHQRVLGAGMQGVPVPAGATLPGDIQPSALAVTTGEQFPGVERPPIGLGPGTWLITLFTQNGIPTGFAWCTANFVFQSGSAFGLGTAGHCAGAQGLGRDVTAFVVPPPEICVATGNCLPAIRRIGAFSSTVRNNGLGDDFALVDIDPAYNGWMRPTMPVFGGPTGTYGGGLVTVNGASATVGPVTLLTPAFSPAAVGHCGHGVAVGTGGTCRAALGVFQVGTAYAWNGISAPGDSGSGVVLLGDYFNVGLPVPALADLTHIIILDAQINTRRPSVTIGPFYTGMVGGTTIARIMEILGTSWTLVSGGLP